MTRSDAEHTGYSIEVIIVEKIGIYYFVPTFDHEIAVHRTLVVPSSLWTKHGNTTGLPRPKNSQNSE